MFTETFRKKVAKFLVYVMLFCNVSPAFAMHVPDYNVRVERREILNPVTGAMVSGFLVEAQKLVTQTVATAAVQAYQTVFGQVVAPFMMMTAAVQLGMAASLQEILQKAKAEAQIFGSTAERAEGESAETSEREVCEVDTEISRGFCLSIPELGDLLISHDGDVVFDTQRALGKTLRISAPSQVVLNNTTAKEIDVEATAAILTGRTRTKIDSLSFRGIGGTDVLTNGLFIDKESELQVGNLSLESALLLNTGKLSVAQEMDLNGGYFFNSGKFLTSADPSILRNISYMFNGSTGSMNASGKMVLGADRFSNLGSVRAQSLSVVTSDLLDNRGTMEATSGMDISGLGTVVNSGRIDGKSGTVAVSGKRFEHRAGEVAAAKMDFGSDETVLAGSVLGQEGFFHGKVAATSNIHLQRAVVDGVFVNFSNATKFEQRLDLTGTRAEIQNKGKIATAAIVSDAVTGIIDDGDVSATSVQSKGHLQLGTAMPELTSVTTDAGAKLLMEAKSAAPKLRRIQNAGNTRIQTATPELADLQNTTTGHLQLEGSASLTKVATLDHLRGKLDVKSSMPAITSLNLQGGAALNLLGTANFSALRDVIVQTGSTFTAETGTVLSGLKNVHNFGTMTTKTQLMGLDAVYNAPTATMHFLERARIQGRTVSAADTTMVPAMASLPGGKIGMFNEGKVLTQVKPRSGETDDPKAVEYRGVDIKGGNYVSSQNAVFRMESGGVRAYDFFNDGIFYSPTRLKYHTFGGTVTRWGRGVAEDGIEYEIDADTAGTLSDTFKPIINGPNKKLQVKSKTGLNLNNPLNWNVDLEVETPTFNGNADLTVRSFKAKTTTFNNTKKLSAKDSIDIETRDFTNTSGRLQTHGDVRINTSGQFRNTGGGRLEKNKPQTLTYYTWSGSGSPVAHTQTIYRDVYHPDLGKAGVITAGRFLDITAARFDNSFGILNAAQRMGVRSLAELCNECGLIYSGGPMVLVGTLLRNGYMRGVETVSGVDPNAPIKESIVVPYQVWVQSGYSRPSAGLISLRNVWVDTSHNETRHRTDIVTTGYGARTQSVSASQYPGYIFSNGDLDIQMDSSAYLGTIVSGGNVRIKGAYQGSINSADRGLLVVRGDVIAELRRAALHQLSIQAQNIYFQLIDDLVIRGIVKPVVLPDGSSAQIIDLQRLGRQMGFLMDGSTFAEQESTLRTPTGFVPMGVPPLNTFVDGFSVYPTASSGFMGSTPRTPFFMPTVQDRILNQLITMTLAPLHGRDMLLSIDLAGQLRRSGARMAGAFRGMHTLTLPDGNPAILFYKSSNPDVEVEVDGETMMVPLYNPYLICDAVSRLLNTIHAERLVSVQSLGDIRLEPGEINIQSEDLTIDSQKQVQIAAEFKYSDTGNRVGVDPVKLSVPGTLTLSGKTGVKTKGFHPSAKTMRMTSSDGSVVDMDMPLDPTFTFLGGGRVTMQQQTATSAFRTSDGMSFSAPMGTIDQHGTDMFAGPGGILFDAQKHTWQPAFEESGYFHSHRKGYVRMHSRTPKVGTMQTPGSVIFRSKDTTLIGAQIIAGTISNPVDGTLKTAPSYSSHQSHSFTTKSGFMGLGSSSVEIEETRELVEPTRMFADHFESLGIGAYEMESTVVRALDATITKNLVEKTAHDKIHTRVTQKSSGFFAPKIKGDPFVESLRGVRNVVTFSGDTLPTAFNIVGTGAQTLAHATTLANLASNKTPITAVAQIFLSRFMTGAVYSNTKTVTTRDESRPSQSKVDVGVLRVTNDRTHLEGVWNVTGRGEIRTGEFTTSAPKHTVSQTQETSGWSVSISPAALLGAYLNPCALTALGCLPNVSVQQSDGTFFQKSHTPAILRADDLFIRAGNAVFSGSKIHSRLMEAIIDGSLTIETLTDEFRSDSHSSAIGGSLAAIGGMLNDVKPDPLVSNPRLFADPRLGAIPTMRFADEESMSQKIQEMAQLVGTEQFYLTVGNLLHKKSALVGLKPDGVVTRNDAERINAGRVLEEQVREAESHKRSVFNPAIGEFVAMMNQIDELQQLRARIAAELAAQNIPLAERERTDKKVQITTQQEEAKVSRVVEETATINDQLNQKVKAKVGEAEIAKLTSGKPVSDATKATVAVEVRGAVAELQTKRDAIAKTSSTSSIDHERGIQVASIETQLGILNERIDMYQQLLFQLGRSSEPVAITRIREGVGAVAGIVGDTCHAADSLSYEQYVEHQISGLPEDLKSNPEFCRDIAAGYFVFKGLAKVGQGVGTAFRAVDDATGNILSWAAHKVGEGFEAVGRAAERGLTSLGAPTMVAQNLADVGEISAQLFGPAAIGSVAKTAAIASGVTKFQGCVLGAVTKAAGSVIDGSKIGVNWATNWFERGYAFENYLETLLPGAKLPYGFKTFDFFSEGTAISAKTLDTNTLARIAKPETINHTIKGYINKMINFTEDHLGRFPTADTIVTKELHLAIPANTSPAHMQQITHAVNYGSMNGIKVVITKVK